MPTTSAQIAATADIYSISVTLIGLDASYAYEGRVAQWAIAGTRYDDYADVPIPPKVSSGGGTTFSGLSPSTTYNVFCGIKLSDGSIYNPSNNGLAVTTLAEPVVKPSNWSWPASMRKGAALYPMNRSVLTAATWNDFVDWVDKVRIYEGLSKVGFSHVNTGDNITSSLISSVINNMNGMLKSHGINMLTVPLSGESAMMSLFSEMSTALNTVLSKS